MLIESEQLKKAVRENYGSVLDAVLVCRFIDEYAEPVDAEPVTRCRDCVFGERMDGAIYCNAICRNVDPDFYCAEGYCHCGAKMDEEVAEE